ncbi:hypothetical protein O3P69_012956 [Scylla paramamosain]|uniref:Uncharacterized protein n=1 Tax=Scylla paramamosain TaxID=85552 RepID=A0AAW0TQV2_SCYPA
MAVGRQTRRGSQVTGCFPQAQANGSVIQDVVWGGCACVRSASRSYHTLKTGIYTTPTPHGRDTPDTPQDTPGQPRHTPGHPRTAQDTPRTPQDSPDTPQDTPGHPRHTPDTPH